MGLTFGLALYSRSSLTRCGRWPPMLALTGTSTHDGVAIAHATLQHLISEVRVLGAQPALTPVRAYGLARQGATKHPRTPRTATLPATNTTWTERNENLMKRV